MMNGVPWAHRRDAKSAEIEFFVWFCEKAKPDKPCSPPEADIWRCWHAKTKQVYKQIVLRKQEAKLTRFPLSGNLVKNSVLSVSSVRD